MWTLLNLVYHEYCKARLLELRKYRVASTL